MDVLVVIMPTAEKDLRSLSKKDGQKVLDKITFFANSGRPLYFAKPLAGILSGKFRFRIGVFRVIFTVDNTGRLQVLNILQIGHRKDIYKI